MKNKMQENPNQTTRILLYMKAGNSITPIQALEMVGSLRLGARIWDIKQMGFKIKRELITTNTNKVVAEYSLGKNYTQTQLEL